MNRFIHSDTFKKILNGSTIVLLDGGARGSLFSPFDKVDPALLCVVKVEPDADASVSNTEQEVVLNKAIWSEASTIPIHLAKEPSVSSVYPPNLELASRFIDIIGKPARETAKIVHVQADSIDGLFEKEQLPKPDFIKLDIHGCEWEALSGAIHSLASTTIALIVESWVIEAHNGQQLLFKTDQLLHEKGFYPHETSIGSWDYKNTENLRSKGQSVISESLYFKDVIHTKSNLDVIQGAKLIAVAELYGHVGFALLLCDYLKETNVLTAELHAQITCEIKANNHQSSWSLFLGRVRNKLIRILIDKSLPKL